jgi:pimeloyl-ACP methyl ester carboxylesterase
VGDPPIVLINGGDGPIEGWYKLLPKLTQASTVLAYNRAGIGRTSKAEVAQTSPVVVDQLRALLEHLELRPPWLLVGHSLGGLHAQYFARAFPDHVCGLVLLDATAAADVELMAGQQGRLQRLLQRSLDRLFDRHCLSEGRNAAASAELTQRMGAFPDIPLSVISGKPGRRMGQTAREGRMANQVALSRLARKGHHVIAEGSGHFPQFSEPDLVALTILETLREARRNA